MPSQTHVSGLPHSQGLWPSHVVLLMWPVACGGQLTGTRPFLQSLLGWEDMAKAS